MVKKIGFLGCGNMGSAIISGLIRNDIAEARNIFVYDVMPARVRETRRRLRISSARDISSLMGSVDTIVLAFKPQDLKAASLEIRPGLTPKHLVLTILAGVPTAKVREVLGHRLRVVRAMPNLGATVGESVTAITGGASRDLATAERIFSGCGHVVRLPEKLFDAVTALSGSGPAYFFYLMELLVEEGVRWGIPRAASALLVKQTAKASASLAWKSADPISVLRARVTSKGGTTEAALATFEKLGWPAILRQAISNAVNRARILGRG